MKPFTHTALPGRVVFGAGALDRLPDEVDALGMRRVFLVADGAAARFADAAQTLLGSRCVVRWNDVRQHVPVELADRARAEVTAGEADGVVSIGGGSATGLAKAIALSHGVPVLAVPTTYAGSEMTAIYGLTGGAHKQTGKNPVVLPRTVIYDPSLTVDLPASVTGPSAFNALAHCVEALYGPGNNPVVSALSLEGISALSRSVGAVIADPSDLDARGDLLYGAYLAGVALGHTGTALHHKACHVLGGMFDLVHGDMNSVVLPHAVAYNAVAVPELMDRVRVAVGADAETSAADALFDLAASIGAPQSLAAIGCPEVGLAEAAVRLVDEINVSPQMNPRAVDVASVEQLLRDAYVGSRPS